MRRHKHCQAASRAHPFPKVPQRLHVILNVLQHVQAQRGVHLREVREPAGTGQVAVVYGQLRIALEPPPQVLYKPRVALQRHHGTPVLQQQLRMCANPGAGVQHPLPQLAPDAAVHPPREPRQRLLDVAQRGAEVRRGLARRPFSCGVALRLQSGLLGDARRHFPHASSSAGLDEDRWHGQPGTAY